VQRRDERIVGRWEGPSVVPVETGQRCRRRQEQEPDRDDKRILPPKASAQLVVDPPVELCGLVSLRVGEIDDAELAVKPILRYRPAGTAGSRFDIRGGLIIVADSAHSYGWRRLALLPCL
jgi:hypothetical protein